MKRTHFLKTILLLSETVKKRNDKNGLSDCDVIEALKFSTGVIFFKFLIAAWRKKSAYCLGIAFCLMLMLSNKEKLFLKMHTAAIFVQK